MFYIVDLRNLDSLEIHGSTSPAFERLVVSSSLPFVALRVDCLAHILTLGNMTDTEMFSNVIQADFSNLRNLQTLSVARHSLGKVRSFIFAQSPLKVVTIGPESLLKVETLSLGGNK